MQLVRPSGFSFWLLLSLCILYNIYARYCLLFVAKCEELKRSDATCSECANAMGEKFSVYLYDYISWPGSVKFKSVTILAFKSVTILAHVSASFIVLRIYRVT